MVDLSSSLLSATIFTKSGCAEMRHGGAARGGSVVAAQPTSARIVELRHDQIRKYEFASWYRQIGKHQNPKSQSPRMLRHLNASRNW